MKESYAALLGWAECLLADIKANAIRYEDGSTYEDAYVEKLEEDIAWAKKFIH
jgi:hypothetical protein